MSCMHCGSDEHLGTDCPSRQRQRLESFTRQRQPSVVAWQQKSRWMPLIATSNSGKVLFVCLCCGRQSHFPDKACPSSMKYSNGTTFTCQEWESDPHNAVGPVNTQMAGVVLSSDESLREKRQQEKHDKDTAVERMAELADYLYGLPEDEKRNKAMEGLGEALALLVGNHCDGDCNYCDEHGKDEENA